MENQLKLFEAEESYCVKDLLQQCSVFVKKKFPKATEDEDYEEYLNFLKEEIMLEYAYRLHKIAESIEKRIYQKQEEVIKNVYKGGL